MTWSLLAQSLEKQGEAAVSAMENDADEAQKSISSLEMRLRELLRGVDARDAAREARTRAEIDVGVLKTKVSEQRWSELRGAEVRAVARLFREFEVRQLRPFLNEYPAQWRQYLRSLIRAWSFRRFEPAQSGGEKEFDAYAVLSSAAPRDAWPLNELPIERPILLMRDGPMRLAGATSVRTLPLLAAQLSSAGLPQSCELFAACLAGTLVLKENRSLEVGSDVQWMMSDPDIVALLMPPRRSAKKSRPDLQVLQARVVAALLGCRLKSLMTDGEFELLERQLLSSDCEFGDPRMGTSQGWKMVTAIDKPAFDSFLEMLIRTDLRFFFHFAMKDKAREEFWLLYLKSLRRTVCFLDAISQREFLRTRDRIKPELLPDFQLAFDRARKLEQGRVSAFCLYFDDFVVVEFSETGHAVYVYERDLFEKHVTIDQKLFSANELKQLPIESERLIHRGDWRPKFFAFLRRRRVQLDGEPWRRPF